MIDMTPVGHMSATGQLKQTFLGNWPPEKFLQFWNLQISLNKIRVITLYQTITESEQKSYFVNEAVQEAAKFNPDVIYFRPIDMEVLFDVAELTIKKLKKPLILHIMDDWPERLRLNDTVRFNNLNARLIKLIQGASVLLSISQAMSYAFNKRYGRQWIPLANGVRPADFPTKDWKKRPPVTQENPFVVRYMGGLAEDMTLNSLSDFAVIVSVLSFRLPIRLEIYTMDWYLKTAKTRFGSLNAVYCHELVEYDRYKRLLCESDAILIPYNFDKKTIAYTRLSLANKMPESFASGAVVIAYGPPQIATIDYIDNTGCAEVVKKNDFGLLRSSVEKLVSDQQHCIDLCEKALKYVKNNLLKKEVQNSFYKYIVQASKTMEAEEPQKKGDRCINF